MVLMSGQIAANCIIEDFGTPNAQTAGSAEAVH